MDTLIAKRNTDAAQAERAAQPLEQECEAWDWARAAGVSAQELREALRSLLSVQIRI